MVSEDRCHDETTIEWRRCSRGILSGAPHVLMSLLHKDLEKELEDRPPEDGSTL